MPSAGSRRNVIASLVITLACFTALSASSPAGLLINQFIALDSTLGEFTRTLRPSRCDSATLARALGDLLLTNTGLSSAAIVDTRGRVAAFAGSAAGKNAFSQKVTRREWFTVPRKTMEPWFGPLSENDHRFFLVWSRPVLAPAALGGTACEGLLVVHVNIAECFKNFAEIYGRPFEMARDSTVFFHTDTWQTGLPVEEEPLTLMGGVAFTLRYTNAPLPETTVDSIDADAFSAAEAEIVRPAAPPLPEKQPRKSVALPVAGMLGLAGILAGAVFAIRRKQANDRQRSEERIRAKIIQDEKEDVRKNVKADMYQEIRSKIGKTEVFRIEQVIKEGLRSEIERTMLVSEGARLREELEVELREKIRAELGEEIRRQMVVNENDELREETRAKLLNEYAGRLRGEVGAQLEMEALQALTRTVHAEVRAEHAKAIRERAFKELEERTIQEVAIRERAMLVSGARASLREEIEKEIVESEGPALREEVRARVIAAIRTGLETVPDRSVSGAALPAGDETADACLRDMRAVLRKIDDSEALASLSKTVDLLKSSQQDSPYFNLNAAQTRSMIDYLENISGRLQGYVGEMKNGINRLCGSVDRLLRQKPVVPPVPPHEEVPETVPAVVVPEQEPSAETVS